MALVVSAGALTSDVPVELSCYFSPTVVIIVGPVSSSRRVDVWCCGVCDEHVAGTGGVSPVGVT